MATTDPTTATGYDTSVRKIAGHYIEAAYINTNSDYTDNNVNGNLWVNDPASTENTRSAVKITPSNITVGANSTSFSTILTPSSLIFNASGLGMAYIGLKFNNSTFMYLLPNKTGTIALAENVLPLTGGTITGNLNVLGNLTVGGSTDVQDIIATKSYVDQKIAIKSASLSETTLTLTL